MHDDGERSILYGQSDQSSEGSSESGRRRTVEIRQLTRHILEEGRIFSVRSRSPSAPPRDLGVEWYPGRRREAGVPASGWNVGLPLA